jgi:5-aminolevulinate synthase
MPRPHGVGSADLVHLELLRADRERAKLIVFESLCSMDGDIAPIAAIADVAERYDAMTLYG